jgi:hypothetical protein
VPWWAWILLVWAVGATALAVWWGLALANADTQDESRRIAEERRSDSSFRTDVREASGRTSEK